MWSTSAHCCTQGTLKCAAVRQLHSPVCRTTTWPNGSCSICECCLLSSTFENIWCIDRIGSLFTNMVAQYVSHEIFKFCLSKSTLSCCKDIWDKNSRPSFTSSLAGFCPSCRFWSISLDRMRNYSFVSGVAPILTSWSVYYFILRNIDYQTTSRTSGITTRESVACHQSGNIIFCGVVFPHIFTFLIKSLTTTFLARRGRTWWVGRATSQQALCRPGRLLTRRQAWSCRWSLLALTRSLTARGALRHCQ